MQLRDYQTLAIDDCVKCFRTSTSGYRRLYASPTGTGKSLIELGIQSQLPNCWLITPRVEIIVGILDKCGLTTRTEAETIETGIGRKVVTPIRFRNLLLNGGLESPEYLLFDEGHHTLADSYQDIIALCGNPPCAGFTATPFRGTPKGTAELLKQWGEPVHCITLQQAAHAGYLSFPNCRMLPLVDDDLVTISNGEFQIESINNVTGSRLRDAVFYLQSIYASTGYYDKPTMVSVPSIQIAMELAEMCHDAVCPVVTVTGNTPYASRQAAFDACISRQRILIQIGVISEGVDLPIRRLFDLSPTLSPVKWLQQLGRITRPSDTAPEYVCTNRNLLRHAYLLDGMLPASDYLAAQNAFEPKANNRANLRVIGLEAIGRFKGIEFPLINGIKGTLYVMYNVNNNAVTNYAAIVHPLKEDVIWATRRNEKYNDNMVIRQKYGRWTRCDPPDGLSGFASVKNYSMTDKQRAWWTRSAARYGLDNTTNVGSKAFQVLPILSDLGCRI